MVEASDLYKSLPEIHFLIRQNEDYSRVKQTARNVVTARRSINYAQKGHRLLIHFAQIRRFNLDQAPMLYRVEDNARKVQKLKKIVRDVIAGESII